MVVKTKPTTFATANQKYNTDKQINVAPVAQLVEHLTLNQRVQGSNPCRRTKGENLKKSVCACSSVGRASDSYSEGPGFEPLQTYKKETSSLESLFLFLNIL